MGIKQVKVAVNELAIGMFVSGLDRPWTQTPFPLQGFYIRDSEEIKELKIHCNHVYVDVAKGAAPAKATLRTLKSAAKNAGSGKPFGSSQKTAAVRVAPLKIRRNVYHVDIPVAKEIRHANELHKQVFHAMGSIATQVARGNAKVSVEETNKAASDMVDSVLRSPDAFTWLNRVKAKDEHTYSHAVRAAVWAILLGRHVGLSKAELDSLATGVLLKDIGKTRLSKELLRKTQRSDSEENDYQSFIYYGVEILEGLSNITPRAVSVVKHHCERINGKGFPLGLQGDKIPLLARIAGLVTYYDDMVYQRGKEEPLSPSKGVAKLYDLRGTAFQDELVVEFIRAIGVYPTGTIVELSSGEVGVIVEQNFERRLKPVVMLVLDADKSPLAKPAILNMAEEEKAQHAQTVEPLTEIERDLEPGAYHINISGVLKQYVHLSNKPKKQGILSMFQRKKDIRLPRF